MRDQQRTTPLAVQITMRADRGPIFIHSTTEVGANTGQCPLTDLSDVKDFRI